AAARCGHNDRRLYRIPCQRTVLRRSGARSPAPWHEKRADSDNPPPVPILKCSLFASQSNKGFIVTMLPECHQREYFTPTRYRVCRSSVTLLPETLPIAI